MEAEQIRLIINSAEQDLLRKLYIIEQAVHQVRTDQYPKEAILVEVLKSIEVSLQERGLLSFLPNSFSPLWFFAETERNIYLWKHRLSLSSLKNFEFWVDVQELIEKRQRQLEACSPDNPFSSGAFARQEENYLIDLDHSFSRIQRHANALSIAGSMVQREIRSDEPRPIVILPQPYNKPAVM